MSTASVGGPVGVAEQLLVLLLTDVESSTQHWLREPQRMPAALDVLDVAVEHSMSQFGGEIVRPRGEGDSHFVVFPRASTAVRAAAALQQSLSDAAWPDGMEFRVRIAIHAGEVQRRNGDYAGVAIHHAARLRSAAHGGQVLVSRAIVELLGNGLDDELRFKSLGRHRIRDIPGWAEVFQLCAPSLAASFPPLVTLDTGLPPVTAIVFLDAVGTVRSAEGLTGDEERTVFGRLAELFATNFSACDGQYLKQLGDGCVALFADPDGAVAFARGARSAASRLDVALRSVVHLGRVDFVHEEPIGRSILVAATLLRQAPTDRIALSPTAAALIDQADDFVTLDS
jgi:class 3 adenylate cyclase